VTINFPEDSKHYLEYKCNDSVGKESRVYSKIYRVDSAAPEITKIMHGPYKGPCPPAPGMPSGGADECFVDSATSVEIQVSDPDPTGFGCAIGEEVCKWRYRVWDVLPIPGGMYEMPAWTDWNTSFIITFPEESYHEVEVYCEDGLGNAVSDVEWFSADHTAPGIDKYYGEPFEAYQFKDYWAKWASSVTPIFVNVSDDGAHKSGIDEVKYRTFRVDDEDCKYEIGGISVSVGGGSGSVSNPNYGCDEVDANDTAWTVVDPADYSGFEFNILEDSCHMIEIMANDSVGKCALHKQWVYVDNQPVTPNKAVGEPKILWDGADGIFYTDEYEHCWDRTNESIDCFKVTMDTPITMECIDPEPHPVEHEQVCFMVGLDGDDATWDYCEMKDGNMNREGYCCLDSTTTSFTFEEESEHNLKYYCEDALGNKGPIDEEKFKVLGNMFEIQINKKWNLISVPFDPLDTAPYAVFRDIKDEIDAVYSYDAEAALWRVYRPDGAGVNDLDEIRAGRGYWIMALNDTMLIVGGSLYEPGVMPSNEELVEGWNLIGYYETEGLPGYYGPEGNGDTSYCALYSLRNLDGNSPTNWGALLTYWELDNEQGSDPWKRISVKTWWNNDMDPGAGYWIAMDEDDRSYYPPTTCTGIYSMIP